MSDEMKNLEAKLNDMTDVEIVQYQIENYDHPYYDTKKAMIDKIMSHEATRPSNDRYKTMSETCHGTVVNIEDVGKFIDESIILFKKSNITPISKIVVEIDEILGELTFIIGYNIKVINIDLQNEFESKDLKEKGD